MKQSIKGALLSGVAYPGLGQMFLGYIFSGAAFIGLTTIGLGIIVYRLAKRIYSIIDQILPTSTKDALDFRKIIDLFDQSTYQSWDVDFICLIVVVLCWLTSTVHAYFLGKRLDRQKGQKTQLGIRNEDRGQKTEDR